MILKTLAAVTMLASSQAAVHVLGFVWKERGIDASTGTIDPNPGTVTATRAYFVFDDSITSAAPGPGTLIEYTDVRSGGVITRTYTIESNFQNFRSDVITGSSGGNRIYGYMYAPVTIADVTGATMPFSGTVFSSGLPKHIALDNTVFQTGTGIGMAGGPRIEILNGTVERSVLSGSANPVNVTETTIPDVVAELEDRLEKAGYTRAAVAPIITGNPIATATLQDGQSQLLSVTLDPDVFGGVTYQWFKNDLPIAAASGGTGASLNVVGGNAATGVGTYHVVVSTSAGTAVSTDTVITAIPYTFATPLPATTTIVGGNSTVLSVVLSPTPLPSAPPTFQWFKNNVAIAAAIGGTSSSLIVVGGEAATGAGTYRVDVTSSAGTISSSTTLSVSTVGTAFAFTANLPRSQAVAAAGTFTLAPTVNPTANPTLLRREWFKAPANDPTAFVAIPLSDIASLVVNGDPASAFGPGVYRMVATSTGATPQVITTISTTITTAP